MSKTKTTTSPPREGEPAGTETKAPTAENTPLVQVWPSKPGTGQKIAVAVNSAFLVCTTSVRSTTFYPDHIRVTRGMNNDWDLFSK